MLIMNNSLWNLLWMNDDCVLHVTWRVDRRRPADDVPRVLLARRGPQNV